MACILHGLLTGPTSLSFHPIFKSGMVLQRGVVTRVWGAGQPSHLHHLLFTCGGLSLHLPLKARGRGWQVEIPAQEGGTTCHLALTCPTCGHLVLQDVLFGDVWLCSGQSNMEQRMEDIIEGEEEMEKSVEDTGVRFMDLARKESTVVVEEWEEVDVAVPWSSPKDRQALANMSAICFLTARYWHRRYPLAFASVPG